MPAGSSLASAAPPSLAEFRARYVENLAALYAVDPKLASRLEALPFADTPALEPTRDGLFTFRLTADDGRPIYAHSRYRPREEAQALIAQQGRRAPASAPGRPDPDDEDDETEGLCFLVNGLGLGYLVAELEARYPRPLLIVAEDDLTVLKAALCVTDFSTPLRERRLTFLTSADKGTVHERLRPALTPIMLGLRLLASPYTSRWHAAFHAGVRSLVRDFVSYSRVQMYSLLRNARITCKNIAFNLPTYLSQPGVEVLKERAAGYPAILVAAGPSLARNFDQLAGLRDRAVLIGVQTVLKLMLSRGVPPHFVTALDYHEISAQFFRGIPDFGAVILVAEPKVSWHVLDEFRGRAHVLHAAFADDLLQAAAPPRAALPAGSTVAHLSFYLAQHLGCDPIILVGQDLSFTEALYYPPGMQVERIWAPELGRFMTVETKQWERIMRMRSGLRRVTDIHGRPAYVDDQMFTYAEQFQADFLASRARVIHACEGGIPLAGTEIMTLRAAAERFCTRPLPPDLFALPPSPPGPEACRSACAALEERLRELHEIRAIATETLTELDRLAGLLDRPAEFNRGVARIDELRVRMARYDRTYGLVSHVSQLAELRRVQADRTISDEQRETPARARRRLRRDREYVAALIDGCDYLLGLLPEALRRVRERSA